MPKDGPIVRERPVRRPGGRRQAVMIVGVVLILAAMLGAAYLIFAPEQQSFELVSYSYARVARGTIEETIQLSGSLSIDRSENVLSPQPGIVASVYVSAGDDVGAGQVVAEISPQELEETLAERRRSLEKLELDHAKRLAERELDLDRFAANREELQEKLVASQEQLADAVALRENGAASVKDLEDAQTAVRAAERALDEHRRQVSSAEITAEYAQEVYRMDLAALEDGIDELEEQIEACVIRSTIDGKVMDTYVAGGDLVSQYGKIIRVADLSRPVVVVDVPQNKMDRIALEQPVTLTVGVEVLPGRIRQVAMEAQESGDYEATVTVEVAFDRPPTRVVPGSTVGTEITLGEISGAVYLPRGPYLSTGNQLYLFRIDGENAYKTEVVFGVVTADRVQLRSGVQEGDLIVVSGYQDFLNYDVVTLSPAGGRLVTVEE